MIDRRSLLALIATTPFLAPRLAMATPSPGIVATTGMIADIARRLRHADRKIESLALLDVYGRVAHALLDFAVPDAQGQQVIKDKISRQDLAKMVGASREMVSRVMKDLEDRGFIEVTEDGSTVIKDRLNTLG